MPAKGPLKESISVAKKKFLTRRKKANRGILMEIKLIGSSSLILDPMETTQNFNA